ncbi:decaprenylphospho-beta-D-erythro-pentofuranosid-2-ulose 2-reductase [Corynebacterium callunae]|uniref:decaprenylphospho-beta-D-erythro-pentofuranosid- 2-ulose 2-reductase n=1 Tax=Corynebacterium callunae TaxID=1721 RepID=UPI0039823C35
MLNAVGKAQNILLLGGTSEIGLSIVERFLKQGAAHVTLAARQDSPRVAAAVAQIEAAGAESVSVVDFDALDTESHPAVIEAAFEKGDVDIAIVAFGILGDNEAQWRDQALAVEATSVNYTAGVSVGVLLGQKFEAQGHGTIVAMSSVAGQRVRRSNFVYGSAKAGFDGFYTQLGEALRGSGANVVVVRAGQVRTKMSAEAGEAPLTVNREDVANSVYDAVVNKKDIIFVHPLFQYVSLAFQFIPRAIFRKLPF